MYSIFFLTLHSSLKIYFGDFLTSIYDDKFNMTDSGNHDAKIISKAF